MVKPKGHSRPTQAQPKRKLGPSQFDKRRRITVSPFMPHRHGRPCVGRAVTGELPVATGRLNPRRSEMADLRRLSRITTGAARPTLESRLDEATLESSPYSSCIGSPSVRMGIGRPLLSNRASVVSMPNLW
jgi:hypothetical protein